MFRDGQVNVLLIRAQLKAALKEKTFGLKELPTSPKTFCQGVNFNPASLLTCVELEVFLGEPTTNFALKVFHADSGANFAVRIRRSKLTFLLVFPA